MCELDKLKALADGEECTLNWFEEGGGLVTRMGELYYLEEVPQYGGEPRPEGIFTSAEFEKIIAKAAEWT
jgi:hypothetical protein